jgi:NAD(P)-dependent dehydrogenase (short-subunit alcohol dehydrogenase family)
VVFEDPNFERRPYERWSAYGQSKTANILFAVSLDGREEENGIRAFSLHPGAIVDTGLQKHLTADELRAMGVIDADGKPVRDPSRNLKTVAQGASTSVWCATSLQLDGLGGAYCENTDIAPLHLPDDETGRRDSAARGTGTLGVMPYAVDPEAAARLWSLSEELLGSS